MDILTAEQAYSLRGNSRFTFQVDRSNQLRWDEISDIMVHARDLGYGEAFYCERPAPEEQEVRFIRLQGLQGMTRSMIREYIALEFDRYDAIQKGKLK